MSTGSQSKTDVAVSAHYEQLQRRYSLTCTGDYERLVTPWGNSQTPVHRWFHVKEAYSHLLLERVIKDTGLDDDRGEFAIYDPFAGSGTTVASAGEYAAEGGARQVRVTAIETNPFLHVLSSVKASAYQDERPDILRAAKRIVATVSRRQIEPLASPGLSTFANEDYFSEAASHGLRSLSAAIELARRAGEPDSLVDALSVCVGAAVEPSCRLRRDGRALRFEPDKRPSDPLIIFLQSAYEMHRDWLRQPSFRARVLRADARNGFIGNDRDIDLAVFSPPYPNNIDYTEVYKLENWQLGFIRSQEEFSAQRNRTIRSHPSLKFAETYSFDKIEYAEEVHALLDPICSEIPESRYKKSLTRTIYGYADDMLAVLDGAARMLRPRGHLVYVVGNSYHGAAEGGMVIAADLIIARLAELAGFEILYMDVARVPRRRRSASRFLRETVVFARKVKG